MENAHAHAHAIIRRVREPHGILGNMSAHPVTFEGLKWRTTEALFQALRFDKGDPVVEEIRAEKCARLWA